ncbi:MAG: shikimate dehydrogenase [Actinomycetota bacterium]|nr:shikimate dehydrogenase [Actinomycetota bacterium]
MNASADPVSGSPIGGATHVAGVIGWPVEHSLSPAIHNAAFASLGMDWVYVPLPVAPGAMRAAADGLVSLGFRGANVTMPHKTESAELAHELSDDARRLRAVNTFVVVGDRLHGHNTDAPGFDRFLRRDVGMDPAGRSALVFGAGGAARAVALALAHGGVGELRVAVREASRAEDLRAAVEGTGPDIEVVPFESVEGMRTDVVVNATPLGADGSTAPPMPSLAPGVVVVDLLYRPVSTPLLAAAREAGAEAFGGLGLLLHQAALAFELFTGTPAPLEAMSAAALGALAERN